LELARGQSAEARARQAADQWFQPGISARRRGAPPQVVPAAASEVFTQVWRRSADLAEMGLEAQAAEAYANLASATSDSDLAAQAFLRAAREFGNKIRGAASIVKTSLFGDG